jgi:AraC-like DNA-binding protein
VQRVIAPFGFAIETCEPEEFLERLHDPAYVCAIIDPAALDGDHLLETVVRLRQQPRPTVVCAPSFPASIQDAVRIASETGAAVAIQSQLEDRAALARTLLAVVPPTDAAMLLDLLAPMLATFPPPVRSSFVGMFAADAPVESPTSFASRALMSRRSLDRWLERAGAPTARRLVALPPVMRALRLLRETRLPIRTVAAICGLRSPRRLQDYTVDLTGLTPSEIRTGADSMETLIERMVASLTRSGR